VLIPLHYHGNSALVREYARELLHGLISVVAMHDVFLDGFLS
jgi:hypothetical protein